MSTMLSLVSRHSKVFRRERTTVFFSLLSVLIVILLYALFLQKTQLDAISQMVTVTTDIKSMVNEWMVAGLLSILAITTTLGAFGIYVQDLETKRAEDFLTMPISRGNLLISYVINAFIIGSVFSILALIGCEIFLVSTGDKWIEFPTMLKMVGVLLLAVTLASSFNLVCTLLVESQTAFSTLSTIIGTVIGFLCGVYVPMGALPEYVQKFMVYFPLSHPTVMLRNLLMNDSLGKVFAGAPIAKEEYMSMYGVTYEWHHHLLSQGTHIVFILGASILFCIFSILVYPALTGSKTPHLKIEREAKKIDGRSTARKSPIGSGQQDVGHSGVATGRGAFNLSFSSSVGDEENPH
ncbi:ABC transporter permease [Rummeliibacillus suwonensis]|uniref:ABC transporter permease n=1 Tax=Rummeliibacillus suwonensis TaxID=1306154 RepID=UPI0011B70574|nr:ABC transporter permease [Rummeliibacillus suwonensis]